MRVLFLILLLFIAPLSASAEDTPESTQKETRIEVDEDNHVIRFFIDGKEEARLTKDGFIVRNSIEYGGRMRDNNGEPFKKIEKDIEQKETGE